MSNSRGAGHNAGRQLYDLGCTAVSPAIRRLQPAAQHLPQPRAGQGSRVSLVPPRWSCRITITLHKLRCRCRRRLSTWPVLSPPPPPPAAAAHPACCLRLLAPKQVLVRADSVLIANTKGGGHAFLGLHLAKKLLNAGHSVTILNDGDPVSSVHGCNLGALC